MKSSFCILSVIIAVPLSMLPASTISNEDKEKINRFEVRDDDIFLIGFPKTGSIFHTFIIHKSFLTFDCFNAGTTWCQEMVWLIANDLNFEEAGNTFIDERFPLLEFSRYLR